MTSTNVWKGGAALTVHDIVTTYGSIVGGNAVFDFGGGNVATVRGVTSLAILLYNIAVV